MKKVLLILFSGIFCLSSLMTTAQTTHGFKLIEKRFVKEVNAYCYLYEHVKSGARLVKIANDDNNKTFSIAFKTVPYSDNGVAHIMEHSVLNGSDNFPVKSPFDVLMKGSLKTFINAFTSKDYTMYPMASMNDKDYFNLMHVYLDAVFHPLIYKDQRILKQEGWHYEAKDAASPVIYKGVVYNEMKGAYSSPTRELSYQIYKNLFPESPYGWESGGYPSAIPTLTYEEFLNFHKTYYAPENSYIMLYGNADMDKEMEFIDREYLSHYTKTNKKITIPEQKPFAALKDFNGYYSVMEGAPTKEQTYLSLSYVAGKNTDHVLVMALDILCDVLFNQDNAPVRLALEKEGIGKEVNASVTNYMQNVITINVSNAEATDKARFYSVVKNTLNDVIKNGIDMKEVEGVLNRYEFQLREGNDAQKGISYMSQMQGSWFFANDPFSGLEYEKRLENLKAQIKTGYLTQLIGKYFVNNTHGVLMALEPKPGLDKEKNDKQDADLAAYKSKLSTDDLNKLVNETNQLIEFQKREDSPEALASIPLLKISDINPKAEWYGVEEKQAGNTKIIFHNEFTNNIIYTDLYFDLHALPQELLPYASLLTNLLTSVDTKKYSFGELNRELNTHTGNFYTSLDTYFENQDDNKMIAKFTVSSKMMNNKADKMFELATEILNNSNLSDTARLHSVIERYQAQLDAGVKRDGSRVAAARLASYITKRGWFNETTSGLDYYWFITDLTNNFSSKSNEIVDKLKQTAALLFTRDNMIVATTCNSTDLPAFMQSVEKFAQTLSQDKNPLNTWNIDPQVKNEGIQTGSKVQYVIAGYDFKKLGYAWNGKMRVLNQIISRDWLTNQVRVIGGAYGGYATISPLGTMTFNSYRDPNLKTTLDNYKGTAHYLETFTADENTMTRYILGTISGIDQPLTPPQKGDNAYSFYFSKRTLEDVQRDRTDILNTTATDIKSYSTMIQSILDQNAICVYGNKEKLNAEPNLFHKLITLEK